MSPARLVMPLVFVAWAGACAAMGALRPEHVVLAVVAPTMAWASPRSGDLFDGLLPIGLLGLVYDAMRWVKDVGVSPSRVHACDLRAFDARLFGVRGPDGAPMSLPDFWRGHAHPLLDRLCAIPYGTFIFVTIGVAIWLWRRDPSAFRAFGWTFLALNLAGFATYHLYPAAPPWYVQERGCLVDLSAHASEGPNLARVDAWLGIGWFHAFYGRSSDVFGAVPSLHVAYPLLCLLFGWRTWRTPGRVLGASFFGLMCFAAVYLAHHWVTDVVVGVVFTLVAAGAASFCRRPADAPELSREAAARGLARTRRSSRGPHRAAP